MKSKLLLLVLTARVLTSEGAFNGLLADQPKTDAIAGMEPKKPQLRGEFPFEVPSIAEFVLFGQHINENWKPADAVKDWARYDAVRPGVKTTRARNPNGWMEFETKEWGTEVTAHMELQRAERVPANPRANKFVASLPGDERGLLAAVESEALKFTKFKTVTRMELEIVQFFNRHSPDGNRPVIKWTVYMVDGEKRASCTLLSWIAKKNERSFKLGKSKVAFLDLDEDEIGAGKQKWSRVLDFAGSAEY